MLSKISQLQNSRCCETSQTSSRRLRLVEALEWLGVGCGCGSQGLPSVKFDLGQWKLLEMRE